VTPRSASRPQRGFTLVELVIVLLVVGVLAVWALPRMVDVTAFRLRAYADELAAQSLAMQRMALQQRRPIVATITAGGVAFAYSGGSAIVSVACPATASSCIAEGGTRSVTFNAANTGGAVTSSGTMLPVTVSASGTTLAYAFENETGLFRALP
jgi:prepilin-type N-terminal cleavage/methylation domain-containing protein